MRLVAYRIEGRDTFGLVRENGIVELKPLLDGFDSIDDLIARHGTALDDIIAPLADRQIDVSLDHIEFLPPVLRPRKIICVGLNYSGHVSATGRKPNEKPTLFSRWADTHVGHRQPIILPSASERLDYEGEMAVIIGKQGRHISERDAMSHVAGYSCYNDGSIRDWQRHSSQFLPGKNFIASGSFGPWLVTAGAVADYRTMKLTTRLNGVVMQKASLAQMIFDLPALIAYISIFTRLDAGDVIVSGTPEGVGAFRKPPVWMKAGDTVEVEVTGIGTLSNIIEAETPGGKD